MRDRTYISFDWALKRLLRDKANFGVLEGLISTLLQREVKILRMLESEGNKDREEAKSNRVDVLAEDGSGELLLIEVQGESEFAYFQRILFGTSKLVTEYIDSGQNYENVKKVYSINIVYFDLGQGRDSVYHGKTEFRGIHEDDVLELSAFQKQKFGVESVYQLYPEYFILKVNDFNRWSKVPLDQWLYFLANSELPEAPTAPGLAEAQQKLRFAMMSREEQSAYRRYMEDRTILADQIVTARGEARLEALEEGLKKGLAEGREQGLAEGHEKGLAEGITEWKKQIARNLKAMGLTAEQIAQATGLPIEAIYNI